MHQRKSEKGSWVLETAVVIQDEMTSNRKPSSTMKLHSLISAVVLGLAVLAQAQDIPPAPSGGKPVAGDGWNSGIRIETLTLKAGPLGEVVAQVERHFIVEDPKKPDVVMPNILYGGDAYNAEVPGDLRVRGVSALQAVALAAAAAGCTLEPVFAPKEAPDAVVQKAIGYRIVRVSAFTRLQSSVGSKEQPLSELDRQINILAETLGQNNPNVVAVREHLKQLTSADHAGGLVGIGIALSKKDGGIVVEQVLPDSPASFSPAIKPGRRILSVAEEGKPAVDVAGLELEKVVQMIRGAPGTVVKITLCADTNLGMGEHVFSLVRARLPVLPPGAIPPGTPEVVKVFNSISPRTALSAAQFGNSSTMPADNNVASVTVYALGSILSGSDEESRTKQRRCQELIGITLSQADLNSPKSPDLSFHPDSRVLVVKATAAQHRIIAQVINALKENETQPAAPDKP
jgi:hypothetical protein